jgi:hypothetical protein
MDATVHGIMPHLRTVSAIITNCFHLVESPPPNFLNAVFTNEVDWSKFTGGSNPGQNIPSPRGLIMIVQIEYMHLSSVILSLQVMIVCKSMLHPTP